MKKKILKCFSLIYFFTILFSISFTCCSDKKPTESKPVELLLTKSTQIFQPARTRQIALGDLDGDGDLDAVFSNMGENYSSIWLNDGNGIFTKSEQNLTKWGHGIGISDLDGDDDIDLFITCASESHPSRIYFNDGQAGFSNSQQDLGDTILSGNAVYLADFDMDGDQDVVVVYYQQPDKMYLNDGNGNFTASTIIIPENSTFVDLDMDGDIDIFYKEHGIGYKTKLNDGQCNFSDYWQLADTEAYYGSVSFSDLDGDGDLDAFVCNGDQSVNYPSKILLNNGNGNFVESGQQLCETSWGMVGLGDLNGDHYTDAFISNFGQPNQVWLNSSTGQFEDSGLRMSGDINDYTIDVTMGDVDNDGDLDIFVANFAEGRNELWFNESY